MVYRLYVERKPGFDHEAHATLKDLTSFLRIEELTGVPIDIISTGPDRTETMILRDPFDA